MNLSEIQTLVAANMERYEKVHGIELTPDVILLKLVEETGEFVQALLVSRNQCREEKRTDAETAKQRLAEEYADVFSVLLSLASKLDIDLLPALEEKVLRKGRAYLEEKKNL